jgi:hypothetical protein
MPALTIVPAGGRSASRASASGPAARPPGQARGRALDPAHPPEASAVVRYYVATSTIRDEPPGRSDGSGLAERLKEHGLPSETEASIKAKLRRGTFTATFLLATLAALELGGVRLEDL